MMSGHGANPILEVRRPKHSLTPLSPPTSDNISFLPYPPPLNVDVTCVSPLRLTSKFMTSQTGQQIITIQILPNISRSKGNQTTKLGHLTEYNMRNIFLEKLYTQCGGEASPRHFYILKLRCCFYLNIKPCLKTKRGLELVSLPHFLYEF